MSAAESSAWGGGEFWEAAKFLLSPIVPLSHCRSLPSQSASSSSSSLLSSLLLLRSFHVSPLRRCAASLLRRPSLPRCVVSNFTHFHVLTLLFAVVATTPAPAPARDIQEHSVVNGSPSSSVVCAWPGHPGFSRRDLLLPSCAAARVAGRIASRNGNTRPVPTTVTCVASRLELLKK